VPFIGFRSTLSFIGFGQNKCPLSGLEKISVFIGCLDKCPLSGLEDISVLYRVWKYSVLYRVWAECVFIGFKKISVLYQV
jgi:hypothetical protein